MVTIHDIDDDSLRILEQFWVLPPEAKSHLLYLFALEVCDGVLAKSPRFSAVRQRCETNADFLENVLKRCQPTFPWAWMGDLHWAEKTQEEIFHDQFRGQLGKLVLASEDVRDKTVAFLCDRFDEQIEYANSLRSGHRLAPDELGIERSVMESFIEDWRDSFMAAVHHAND